MESIKRQPRRVSTTLIRESTDWGVSVSEKRVRSSWLNDVLLVLSVIVLLSGFIIALPLFVGLILSAEMTRIGTQITIFAVIVGLAIVFKVQSRKGPRNALEVDVRASEVRLGFMNRHGAFVRQRVIPLARVEDAFVPRDTPDQPELNIVIDGEQIRIALADAKIERLNDIAAQICGAASHARNAPRRSRIRSTIAGVGASYREIGNRVASQIFR